MLTINVGQQATLSIIYLDQNGSPMLATPDSPPAWSNTNPAVDQLTPNNNTATVTGLAAGSDTVNLHVVVNGTTYSASLPVTVQAAAQVLTSVQIQPTTTSPGPVNTVTYHITGVAAVGSTNLMNSTFPAGTPFAIDLVLDCNAINIGDNTRGIYDSGFPNSTSGVINITGTLGNFRVDGNGPHGALSVGLWPAGSLHPNDCDAIWGWCPPSASADTLNGSPIHTINVEVFDDTATAFTVYGQGGKVPTDLDVLWNDHRFSPEALLNKFTLIFTNNLGEIICTWQSIQRTGTT